MSQVQEAARVIATVAELQKTLETLGQQLLAMRLTGADEGLLQDACLALANCEPILAHNIGEVLGHDELWDALDEVQLNLEAVA